MTEEERALLLALAETTATLAEEAGWVVDADKIRELVEAVKEVAEK